MKMTYEQVREHVDGYIEASKTEMARSGQVAPLAVVFGERNPETGFQDKPGVIVMVPQFDFSHANRELFSQMIRQVVRLSRAFAVFFMSEAWTMHLEKGEAIPDQLSTAPGRIEIVFGSLEYAGSPPVTFWRAVIVRDEKDKPKPLVFERAHDFVAGDGRFERFLPQHDLARV